MSTIFKSIVIRLSLVNLRSIIVFILVLESINELVLHLNSSIQKCGVHVQLCPQLNFDTLSLLLMIISQTTWLYLIKNRFKLFSHFLAFYAEIHTQFHVSVQSLRVIMLKNMFQNSFSHACFKMTSFIRPPVLTLLRMEWLRGRIDTSLKLPELYYFKCKCPSISRPMLFPPLVFY